MNQRGGIRLIFGAAAAYDLLLGLAFLTAAGPILERFDVPPPPHVAYIQLPALLIVVFGLMFLAVAAAPRKNRNLIPYGVLMKASYAGVVIAHWFGSGIEDLWKPMAVFDLVWLLLFAWAWTRLKAESPRAPASL